jgi:hypothetical protein
VWWMRGLLVVLETRGGWGRGLNPAGKRVLRFEKKDRQNRGKPRKNSGSLQFTTQLERGVKRWHQTNSRTEAGLDRSDAWQPLESGINRLPLPQFVSTRQTALRVYRLTFLDVKRYHPTFREDIRNNRLKPTTRYTFVQPGFPTIYTKITVNRHCNHLRYR